MRRTFKKITSAAGLGDNWKPLELRTSFVSLMSDSGVPAQEIARREARPVITTGAAVMDKIFAG